jgi:protein-S-isoprenylcysteine O-methyltransferase Ste14
LAGAFVVDDQRAILIFAASFFHPRSGRDWRAFGVFSAFIVALFAEMYGVPLTVYLLSSWLGGSLLGLDLTHNGGHLWAQLVGWGGDPHLSPFHLASYALIFGGFWVMAAAWRHLYAAQREGRLATGGPYARLRHPQYLGFILIMVGFLLQWPTIPTLLMFPVMLLVYRGLAIREEQEVRRRFGTEWDRYAAGTPRFILRRRGGPGAGLHQVPASSPARASGQDPLRSRVHIRRFQASDIAGGPRAASVAQGDAEPDDRQ